MRDLDRPELREAVAALAYTRLWHDVQEWAEAVCSGLEEWSPWPDEHPRASKIRGLIVDDLDNEEEAFKRGVPIFDLVDWLGPWQAPGRVEGGHRRVILRVFTWVKDRDNDVAYAGEWLKIGDDMSAKAADAHARRWAREYEEQLSRGFASREIIMTAIEIAWWTQRESARLL